MAEFTPEQLNHYSPHELERYTPEELNEVERNLEPKGKFEQLYSPVPRKPRSSAVEADPYNIPSFMDGHTPEIITESIAKKEKAKGLREAAIKAGNAIELHGITREAVITTERALARYGHGVADEQGIPTDLVDTAEIQLNEVISGAEVVDAPSLALGALALARMEKDDKEDPIERKAAASALGELPRDPEKIELIKRQQIGHDTGELAVRAILEHEPISA